ncbi:MAG: TonB family protein [Ginsengibacter sp.]
MRLFLTIFLILLAGYCNAQKVVNAVWTNDTDIVTKVEEAKFLIIIKSYNDTAFERLDYSFSGPLLKRKMYSDQNMKVLQGTSATYHPNGYLAEEGNYTNNKKDGNWHLFDDTSHAITEMKYHLDSLLSVTDLDSLYKEKEKLKVPEDTSGQVEASYSGGTAGIAKIISKNFTVPDRISSLGHGGTAKVRFIIDKTGKINHIDIMKSVEYSFDEECMRVVSLLKKWKPANDKGKFINAYRIQPITVNF